MELAKLLEPRLTSHIPHRPHPPQAAFLLLDDSEALFGGAVGGGKSDAILMGALQYVDIPSYHALILRRTFAQLVKADALIPRSHEWLANTDAHWNGDKMMWTFPSGSTLEFGHCQHEKDKYNFQGSAWQYIGFDELTHFTESQYQYIGLSRRRRLEGVPIPLRTRGSANPDGIGFDWVKARFVAPETASHRFVPSKLEDNPSLDAASYLVGLSALSTVEQARLRHGNWDVRPKGPLFDRTWFEIVDSLPDKEKDPVRRRGRFWDLAATEEAPGKDPDWTAGVRVALTKSGIYYVEHVVRLRARPKVVESQVAGTAERDGRDCPIGMEQEPGASGKSTAEHFAREVLRHYRFKGYTKRTDKIGAAELWQPAAERGEVKLLRGRWNRDWLDEVEAFPHGSHDDQVDGTSGAHGMVSEPAIVIR